VRPAISSISAHLQVRKIMSGFCYTIAEFVTVTGGRQIASRRAAHLLPLPNYVKQSLTSIFLCLIVANSAIAGAVEKGALCGMRRCRA